MKVKLNIADEEFVTKPGRKDFVRINKDNVLGIAQKEVTVEELAEELCSGKIVKYALMDSAKAGGWLQQQVFMIDIDNDEKQYGYLTLEEAYKRAENAGVIPAFCYHTYSHMTENDNSEKHMKDKFRMVFILDGATNDLRVRNMVQECLFSIFPERDPACSDAARCFCGTCHRPIYESYGATVSPVGLYVSAMAQIRATNDVKKASDIVKSLREKCHFNDDSKVGLLEEIKTSKISDLSTHSIIYTIEHVEESEIFNIPHSTTLASGKNKKSKSSNSSNSNSSGGTIDEASKTKTIDLVELEAKCELYRRFKNGSAPLHHQGIVMISSNLTQYRGTTQALVQIIEDNMDYYENHGADNKIATIRYYSKVGYGAMSCFNPEQGTGEAFDCPFAKTCSNKGCKMSHVLDNKRLACRQLNLPTATKTADEAYEEVKQALKAELKVQDTDIVIVKAPTGVGKTEALAQILRENPFGFNNINISAPTHDLSREHYERVGRYNCFDPIHIQLPTITDKAVATQIVKLQKLGLYFQAQVVAKKYMNALDKKMEIINPYWFDEDYKNIPPDLKGEYESVSSYVFGVENIRDTSILNFCTHARMLHLSNRNINTYIVDEDIIPSLSTVISVTDSVELDIEKLIIEAKAKGYTALESSLKLLKKFIKDLRKSPGLCIKTPMLMGHFDKTITQAIEEVEPCFNLKDLLGAEFGYCDANGKVEIIKKNNLPNKKIIVLSATADEEVYKWLFPNRIIRVIDVGEVKQLGEIKLHYYSFSRDYFKKNFKKALDTMRAEASGVKDLITFKGYENDFKKEGYNTFCHYGACTGIDGYGGHDMIIAGTPHINVKAYLYLAYLCGVSSPITTGLKLTNVQDCGYEFSFSVFNPDDLSQEADKIRQIQKYKIKSELIQAVGRARTLRNNCTVHIFSSYPIEGSTLY